MTHTISRSRDTIQRHGPPPKKGFGCLVNTLIGLAVLIIAIIGGSWQIVMHTSLPLRFVASVIEEGGADSNLKITGTSGSLSSGLSFKKIEWDDGEITDMRFRYSGLMDVLRRDELIIYEMHIGSATLDSSFFNDTSEETESTNLATQDESTDTDAPASEFESSEAPFRLLQIDRVSLNQIIIKNSNTGNTITIPKIEWTGFKAEKGKELQMGDLKANSEYIVINTNTPSDSEYQKRVEITLFPKLHATLLKPIHINALLGQKDGKVFADVKAFDETVQFIHRADGTQQLRATGVNLAEFLDAPLPDHLQLEAEADDPTLTVRGGSFLLGTKSFEIQPTTATDLGDKPEGTVILALHREGDNEIRYEIPVTESNNEDQSFTPVLTSVPAMSPEDLMALLFHDQAFSDLPQSDQEKLRKHMPWFSFTE